MPISNFFGWYLTAYLYYQSFAPYCSRTRMPWGRAQPSFWSPAILFYAACALGNLLILKQPMMPTVVADATGKQWMTADILAANVLVSVLVMVPFALLAWLRSRGSAVAISRAV